MKNALSVVLFIVLVSCISDRGSRAASGEPSASVSAQRNTAQASSKENAVKPRELEAVFPHIKPAFRTTELLFIENYCQQQDIRKLSANRVRLFIQPMGVVAEAIEIDFEARRLIVYPGTDSREKIFQTQLDEEQTAQIRALVTSAAFTGIPRENQKMGVDGTSYLLEASLGKTYLWKLHWLPDDKELMKVIDQIEALTTRKKATEPVTPADADKRHR